MLVRIPKLILSARDHTLVFCEHCCNLHSENLARIFAMAATNFYGSELYEESDVSKISAVSSQNTTIGDGSDDDEDMPLEKSDTDAAERPIRVRTPSP